MEILPATAGPNKESEHRTSDFFKALKKEEAPTTAEEPPEEPALQVPTASKDSQNKKEKPWLADWSFEHRWASMSVPLCETLGARSKVGAVFATQRGEIRAQVSSVWYALVCAPLEKDPNVAALFRPLEKKKQAPKSKAMKIVKIGAPKD